MLEAGGGIDRGCSRTSHQRAQSRGLSRTAVPVPVEYEINQVFFYSFAKERHWWWDVELVDVEA